MFLSLNQLDLLKAIKRFKLGPYHWNSVCIGLTLLHSITCLWNTSFIIGLFKFKETLKKILQNSIVQHR